MYIYMNARGGGVRKSLLGGTLYVIYINMYIIFECIIYTLKKSIENEIHDITHLIIAGVL